MPAARIEGGVGGTRKSARQTASKGSALKMSQPAFDWPMKVSAAESQKDAGGGEDRRALAPPEATRDPLRNLVGDESPPHGREQARTLGHGRRTDAATDIERCHCKGPERPHCGSRH